MPGNQGTNLSAQLQSGSSQLVHGTVEIHRRLFQQEWWQVASAGDRLERVEVDWDGRIVGSLCFIRDRIWGLRLLKLPPYTRTQSPVLNLPQSKAAGRIRNTRKVVQSLMDALPKHDRFQLFLDPSDSYAFYFALAGCAIEEDFTFRLHAGTDLERFWGGLDPKTRNLIRRSSKSLEVTESGDIEAFVELSQREHRGHVNKHDFGAIRRIAAASRSRSQSTLLVAKNEHGEAVAVSMLVWDTEVLFYWQSSRAPEEATPGVNSYLVWRAIQFAMDRGLAFDFDGYSSRASAMFATKFGIAPVARPSVIHMNMVGWCAQKAALALGRQPGG